MKSSTSTNSGLMAAVNIRISPIGMLVIGVTAFVLLAYATGFVKSPFSTQKVSMRELLSASIDLAKKGGAKVKAVHESHILNEEEKSKTKEGKAELKTEGDMKSHIAIVYGFHKGFPDLTVSSRLS